MRIIYEFDLGIDELEFFRRKGDFEAQTGVKVSPAEFAEIYMKDLLKEALQKESLGEDFRLEVLVV